jgi:hypothetical protein
MNKSILSITAMSLAFLGFISSCKKEETSFPADLIAPEITIVSPPPAKDTTINGQVYQIYSSFSAGSNVPINLEISDNVGLDSIFVEVIDSTTLAKLFVGTWFSAQKSLSIDTGFVAPNINSICSIKVEAYDQNGNVLGRVRAFGINP